MKAGSPATNPDRKPGSPERFDSELKVTTLAKLVVGGKRRLERAGGRGVGIDLRIAFVGEQHEVEAPRERDCRGEVAPVCHRALRIGGCAEIERDGAPQELLIDGVERRKELRRAGAVEKHGLGP